MTLPINITDRDVKFNMPTINRFPPSTKPTMKPSKGERGVEEDRSMTTNLLSSYTQTTLEHCLLDTLKELDKIQCDRYNH